MGTILKIDRRALLKLGLSTAVLASVPVVRNNSIGVAKQSIGTHDVSRSG